MAQGGKLTAKGNTETTAKPALAEYAKLTAGRETLNRRQEQREQPRPYGLSAIIPPPLRKHNARLQFFPKNCGGHNAFVFTSI